MKKLLAVALGAAALVSSALHAQPALAAAATYVEMTGVASAMSATADYPFTVTVYDDADVVDQSYAGTLTFFGADKNGNDCSCIEIRSSAGGAPGTTYTFSPADHGTRQLYVRWTKFDGSPYNLIVTDLSSEDPEYFSDVSEDITVVEINAAATTTSTTLAASPAATTSTTIKVAAASKPAATKTVQARAISNTGAFSGPLAMIGVLLLAAGCLMVAARGRRPEGAHF